METSSHNLDLTFQQITVANRQPKICLHIINVISGWPLRKNDPVFYMMVGSLVVLPGCKFFGYNSTTYDGEIHEFWPGLYSDVKGGGNLLAEEIFLRRLL